VGRTAHDPGGGPRIYLSWHCLPMRIAKFLHQPRLFQKYGHTSLRSTWLNSSYVWHEKHVACID
jgi:hypothetical protein